MNFPMDNPVFQVLFWVLDTPGIGGIAVGIVAFVSVSLYASALYWIKRGAQVDEPDTYAYPTPTLLEH